MVPCLISDSISLAPQKTFEVLRWGKTLDASMPTDEEEQIAATSKTG